VIGTIISSVSGLATSYLDSKSTIAKAKAEKELKIASGELSWEVAAMEATKNSWKDELWTIVFVIILIANFIPLWGIQELMAKGFANLQQCPDWVTYGMYASIASSFGLRSFSKLGRKK